MRIIETEALGVHVQPEGRLYALGLASRVQLFPRLAGLGR